MSWTSMVDFSYSIGSSITSGWFTLHTLISLKEGTVMPIEYDQRANGTTTIKTKCFSVVTSEIYGLMYHMQ